jgi:hypothetical protein
MRPEPAQHPSPGVKDPVPCGAVSAGTADVKKIPVGAPALCVPRTLSTSCDQAVFVDHATDTSVSPDVVSLKIDRFG